MAMFNYEVGGNEVKVDANEAINEIQANKTMLVSQLTADEPIQPETVGGLKTLEDVFRHFKPSIEVEMQTAQGEAIRETMKFGKLDDFTPKGITRQSAFLNTLKIQQEQYTKIMKQLKSNKVLQTMLANAETKEAIVNALRQVAGELEASAEA
ncbi:type VI secretion system contractile sheath small subunit [Taibaiella koreensis]|uniref:type VI secretion system contractile sheath small subunit n=1 Tax=Taibaiella koreensis TaxID=1268548 RepID=UPI0019691A0E|nr:type VI secretion system contractile sheath small subunit [Taibaiella koreensis]